MHTNTNLPPLTVNSFELTLQPAPQTRHPGLRACRTHLERSRPGPVPGRLHAAAAISTILCNRTAASFRTVKENSPVDIHMPDEGSTRRERQRERGFHKGWSGVFRRLVVRGAPLSVPGLSLGDKPCTCTSVLSRGGSYANSSWVRC